MNPRRAVERIDLQSRIIRQDIKFLLPRPAFRLALRQPAAQFDGFFRRVARECVRVFDRFRRARKILQGEILKTLAENGANLLHLVRISRGDEENDHAALWTALNRSHAHSWQKTRCACGTRNQCGSLKLLYNDADQAGNSSAPLPALSPGIS